MAPAQVLVAGARAASVATTLNFINLLEASRDEVTPEKEGTDDPTPRTQTFP